MIESVKKIVTVKAVELPPVFDVRVGNVEYPFEIEFVTDNYVYMRDLMNNELVHIHVDESITILIPDSLNDPVTQMEIFLALHNEGVVIE